MITIWIIGWLFTIGIGLKETDGWYEAVILLYSWPLILGDIVKDYMNKGMDDET
jgi:hypothetical protein